MGSLSLVSFLETGDPRNPQRHCSKQAYNTKLLDQQSWSHRLLAGYKVEVPSGCSNNESDERGPGATSLEDYISLHIPRVDLLQAECHMCRSTKVARINLQVWTYKFILSK